MKGTLNDLRIYRHKLGEEEIRTLASSPDSPAGTDIAAWWKFKGDLRDYSGSGRNLTSTGTWFVSGLTERALELDGLKSLDVPDSVPAPVEIPKVDYPDLVKKNPALSFGKILFIKRKTYQSSHYYTDYIDGCKYYGGNICTLDLRTGKVTDLLPSLKSGIFGRFDLSYDAKHIVFDWKAAPDKGFRIYEAAIDGSGLRQLSFEPANEKELVQRYRTVGTPTGIPYITGTDDMHPCYLPNGDIVFISTRCQKGILCDNPDVLTTTVLYRMDKNGKNMRPLSFNSVSETTPSITQDGRILYTRWEYVDKGASACKCIWVMNPDGTHSMEVYANNIAHPTTFLDCRDIPGKPGKYVVVGAPHMPLGVGSVIRLDTSWSLRTLKPMTSLTPEIDTPDESGYRHMVNGVWQFDYHGPLFREPYPLSDSQFLVTYNPNQPHNAPAGYGIYLLDERSNRELVYRDPEYSCWEPYPLRPRPRPALLPEIAKEPVTAPKVGTLLLNDVYKGLTGIQRGRVKYLRVMEDVPRPWAARRYWSGDDNPSMQEHVAISRDGHLAAKLTHGIVPVKPDGSAYFKVPADRNIYLQALDSNYMELQRMRTFINLRSGEVRGCVGCHEERKVVPSAAAANTAFRNAAVYPAAQPGEKVPRTIHYATDIQPILNRHCVSCHSAAKPEGKINLSAELTPLFNASYETIIDKKLVGHMVNEINGNGIGEQGKHANIGSADPLTYGSHTSGLIRLLQNDHHGAKLSREEFIRFVTWVDANAPYYGSYDGRLNLKYSGMPDFRPAPIEGPGATAWSGSSHPISSIRHSFVATDNGRNMIVEVSSAGKITWEYPAEFCQDVWRLPNGNTLFSHLHGAKEVTRDKKVVWEYKAPDGAEVHNCQPLPDGGVMICECGTKRIIEIGRDGKIRKEIKVDTGITVPHMQFRIARKLNNGHYLIAFVGERLVRELDADGAVVRTIPVPGDVFVAIRLPNGNTLIGCGDGHQVIEVDPKDKVVWRLEENELPGHPLRFVAGLQRLPNGNTIVCNWGGHGHIAEQPLMFEVTRDKKVVWQVDDYGLFRTISNVQLIDVLGTPLR